MRWSSLRARISDLATRHRVEFAMTRDYGSRAEDASAVIDEYEFLGKTVQQLFQELEAFIPKNELCSEDLKEAGQPLLDGAGQKY